MSDKIKVNILWVDDNKTIFDTSKKIILRDVAKHDKKIEPVFNCMLPKEICKSNSKEFLKALEVHLKSELYDFFMFDYNLDQDITGEDFIKHARINNEFCDILLYSTDKDIIDKNITKENAILFDFEKSDRDEVNEKSAAMIKKIFSSMHSVSNMRGGFIISAINIENILEDIILQHFFKNDGDIFKQKILNARYLNFYDKYIVLIKHLKEFEDTTKILNLRKILNSMKKEIIDARNMLAHSKINEDGVIPSINNDSNSNDITPDITWYNKAREDIRKHKKNLMDINQFLENNPIE